MRARVLPLEHDPTCRRGLNPAGAHYGLDRERCERCRNLWRALEDADARVRTILSAPAATGSLTRKGPTC